MLTVATRGAGDSSCARRCRGAWRRQSGRQSQGSTKSDIRAPGRPLVEVSLRISSYSKKSRWNKQPELVLYFMYSKNSNHLNLLADADD